MIISFDKYMRCLSEKPIVAQITVFLAFFFSTAQATAGEELAIETNIEDSWGNPLPGAVLLVEASQAGEVYDFASAVADGQGAVRMKIACRRGLLSSCVITYLALARGKSPLLLHLHEPHQQIVPKFVMEDFHPRDNVLQELQAIAYPYRRNQKLSKKLSLSDYKELREMLDPLLERLPKLEAELPKDIDKDSRFAPRVWLSANGENLAFRYARKEKQYVNIDGFEYRVKGKVKNLVFSNDGRKWMFSFEYGEKKFRPGTWPRLHLYKIETHEAVNLGGKILKPYYNVVDLGFGPDGKSHWFTVQDKNGVMKVVLDGKEYLLESFDEVKVDSRANALFFAHRRDGKLWVDINGSDYPAVDGLVRQPSFLRNGKWFFIYREGGKLFINFQGTVLGGYEKIFVDHIVTRPGDFEDLVFFHQEGKDLVVNKNGRDLDRYPPQSIIRPDGMLAGLLFEKEGKRYAELDGRVFGPFSEMSPVEFSSDGDGYGFYFRDESGVKIVLRDIVVPTTISPPAWVRWFYPAGDFSRAALVFRQNDVDWVYIDGAILPAGDYSSWVHWSDDHRHFGYSYSKRDPKSGASIYHVNIDGQVFGPYESAEDPEFFSPGGDFYFLCKREGLELINANGNEYPLAKGFLQNSFFYGLEGKRFSFASPVDSNRLAVVVDGTMSWTIPLPDQYQHYLPYAVSLPAGGRAKIAYYDEQENAVFSVKLNEAEPFCTHRVEFTATKESFSLGEPITVKLKVKNLTDKVFYREHPLQTNKTLLLLRPAAEKEDYEFVFSESPSSVSGENKQRPPLVLEPGKEVVFEKDLLPLLGWHRLALGRKTNVFRGRWYSARVKDLGCTSENLHFRVQWTTESVRWLLEILKKEGVREESEQELQVRWASHAVSLLIDAINELCLQQRLSGHHRCPLENPFSNFTLSSWSRDALANMPRWAVRFENTWREIADEPLVLQAMAGLNR